jgi:hypothetical protein
MEKRVSPIRKITEFKASGATRGRLHSRLALTVLRYLSDELLCQHDRGDIEGVVSALVLLDVQPSSRRLNKSRDEECASRRAVSSPLSRSQL